MVHEPRPRHPLRAPSACTNVQNDIPLDIFLDNDAARAVCETGRSKQLKYMNKHRRVQTAFVRDSMLKRDDCNDKGIYRVHTDDNKSDLLKLLRLDPETTLAVVHHDDHEDAEKKGR